VLFNSFTFPIFLAAVLVLYFVLAHRWQNRMLLLASYLFYGTWDPRFLSLLLLSTCVDYACARKMGKGQGKRKMLLWVSMVTNLGILGFFKYCNFFVESAADLLAVFGLETSPPVLQVLLPVGISFYTFQSMAYTIDVFRGRQEAHRDFVGFALYVSYFPQLVAGPIERSQRLLTQISKPRVVTWENVGSGVQLIVMGYLKKVAIADSVAPYVNGAFDDPSGHSGAFLLLSVYLFAIQIYGDFSGYSDIARGVSRILGIDLVINFKQPYLSRNITEFWRRWHISLSSWLRDYLYIPLGGNRAGDWKTYRNLMVTMLLGGLWHGASWNFVIWGGLHGLYLAGHKFLRRGQKVGMEKRPSGWGEWGRFLVGVLCTFHLVCLAWIFFRAETLAGAWDFLTGIFTNGFVFDFAFRAPVVFFYLALVLLVDLGCWWRGRETPVTSSCRPGFRGLVYGAMLFIILFIGEPNGEPFIYFQF